MAKKSSVNRGINPTKYVNRDIVNKPTAPAKKGSKLHRRRISKGLRSYWLGVRKKVTRRVVRPGGNQKTRKQRQLPGARRAVNERNNYTVKKNRRISAFINSKTRFSAGYIKAKEKRLTKSRKGRASSLKKTKAKLNGQGGKPRVSGRSPNANKAQAHRSVNPSIHKVKTGIKGLKDVV